MNIFVICAIIIYNFHAFEILDKVYVFLSL